MARVLAADDGVADDALAWRPQAERQRTGAVWGFLAKEPYGPYDPDPDWQPDPANEPIWGWETSEGVWTLQTPAALLVGHARLWGVVTEFCLGLDQVHPEHLSNYEVEALQLMLGTKARCLRRKHKPNSN